MSYKKRGILGLIYVASLAIGLPVAVATALADTGYVVLGLLTTTCVTWGYFDILTTQTLLRFRKVALAFNIEVVETNTLYRYFRGKAFLVALIVFKLMWITIGLLLAYKVSYAAGVALLALHCGATGMAIDTNSRILSMIESKLPIT